MIVGVFNFIYGLLLEFIVFICMIGVIYCDFFFGMVVLSYFF